MVWYVGGIAIGVVLIIALISVAVRGRPDRREMRELDSPSPTRSHAKSRKARRRRS
jgi:hypothetical protein